MAASIGVPKSGVDSSEIGLDRARGAWRIESGSADVFVVERESGVRHAVLRVGPGERMFAIPGESHRIRVLARPSPDAVVLALPPIAISGREIEAWTKRFSTAVHAEAGTSSVIPALERLVEERRANEQARFRSKAAAGDADLRSALSALADPLGTFTDAGATDLFRACEAVAERAGITLQRPDSSSGGGKTAEDVARASSVRVRKVQLRGTWWRRDAGPLLSYREGRPVALIPHRRGRYILFDPASGARETVDAALAARIEPSAHIFYAPLPACAVTPLGLAMFSVRGSRGDLLRVLACSGAAGALALVVPLLTAWFAGSVIPAGDRGQLVVLVAAIIISAICTALFNLAAAMALHRAGVRAGARAMAGLWDRTLALPTSFFRQFNAADLAIRILSIDRARELLAGTLGVGAAGCLFGALQIALLFRFSPMMAWPAVAIVAAISGASALCGRLTQRRHSKIAACEARTAGKTLESIQCIAKLRVAGAEGRAFAAWARSFALGRRESIRARGISAALAALHSAAPLSGWILIAALAGSDTSLRESPAKLLAFGATFQQLLAAALQLSGFLMAWAQVSALARRTQPLLAGEPESNSGGADPGTLRGGLEVRDLTFRYSPNGPAALSHVSLRIEPGEFVALVGSSGSGKSTLLRLLMGFERPEAGSVLYDGRELSTLDLPSVRRQLGVALQGGRILAGDIASNILSATGLGLDAAWKAAEAAGIASDIHAMPMGMHTLLSEDGAGLSGGQRQRLLIARALVRNPRLLLMDEATSALDNRTQSAVTSGLERLGVTRVVVAHRLSTVRRADRIYVLEGGRIVESGSYAELMALKGRFFALAARQNG
jgi:NHLM bacteriocin system ABC transporter ATP-binding protein